jgi:hypothetical protein
MISADSSSKKEGETEPSTVNLDNGYISPKRTEEWAERDQRLERLERQTIITNSRPSTAPSNLISPMPSKQVHPTPYSASPVPNINNAPLPLADPSYSYVDQQHYVMQCIFNVQLLVLFTKPDPPRHPGPANMMNVTANMMPHIPNIPNLPNIPPTQTAVFLPEKGLNLSNERLTGF